MYGHGHGHGGLGHMAIVTGKRWNIITSSPIFQQLYDIDKGNDSLRGHVVPHFVRRIARQSRERWNWVKVTRAVCRYFFPSFSILFLQKKEEKKKQKEVEDLHRMGVDRYDTSIYLVRWVCLRFVRFLYLHNVFMFSAIRGLNSRVQEIGYSIQHVFFSATDYMLPHPIPHLKEQSLLAGLARPPIHPLITYLNKAFVLAQTRPNK